MTGIQLQWDSKGGQVHTEGNIVTFNICRHISFVDFLFSCWCRCRRHGPENEDAQALRWSTGHTFVIVALVPFLAPHPHSSVFVQYSAKGSLGMVCTVGYPGSLPENDLLYQRVYVTHTTAPQWLEFPPLSSPAFLELHVDSTTLSLYFAAPSCAARGDWGKGLDTISFRERRHSVFCCNVDNSLRLRR